ncbi:phosphoribosyltransferase family protein [Streptomyces sp. NPDC005438]|uniref:phosphoribosyltransferase n=1 Tax=Streptomyces sp. NPDC005438 TaxID=3156880 RepID=UPI00339EF625
MFRDRADGGRQLARLLRESWRAGHLAHPLVLALPRGGVPVAAEVAQSLAAPLDVLVVRKVEVPDHPELGVGAVSGDRPALLDRDLMARLGLSETDLAQRVALERDQVRRLEDRYRRGRPEPRLAGHSVVLVDDGVATGVTARAAAALVRSARPARVVLAVPVGAAEALRALGRVVDEVVAVRRPAHFSSVGEWYQDFHQLGDAEVVRLLERTRQQLTPTPR